MYIQLSQLLWFWNSLGDFGVLEISRWEFDIETAQIYNHIILVITDFFPCSVFKVPNLACDPAAPITWALEKNRKYDVFILLSDGTETHGEVKAEDKLKEYRRKMNLPDTKYDNKYVHFLYCKFRYFQNPKISLILNFKLYTRFKVKWRTKWRTSYEVINILHQ